MTMKTTILITILALVFGSGYAQSGGSNQLTTSEFKVFGECGMCKTRIEKAAKVDGVISAEWNESTKILKVVYQPSKITIETIHKNIAKVGHDTELEKADDGIYNKLPSCCKYDRKKLPSCC